MANVVRKTGPSSTAVASVSNQYLTSDGRQNPGIRLEATRRRNGTSLEGSLLVSRFFDDGAGDGDGGADRAGQRACRAPPATTPRPAAIDATAHRRL